MNPNHLRLGTKQDQANRRVANGKQPFGVENSKAKLTPEIASKIYKSYHVDGVTQRRLAVMSGLNASTVSYSVLVILGLTRLERLHQINIERHLLQETNTTKHGTTRTKTLGGGGKLSWGDFEY